MKFGQLIKHKDEPGKLVTDLFYFFKIKHNKANFFLQESCKDEPGKLVTDLFYFFKKGFMR